jgi:putative oxidoreductase
MSLATLTHPLTRLARGLDVLQEPFALATRVYVGWVFLKSGWLKISEWEQTLALFEYEYRTPVLSPQLAAILGTFGELFFPVLLILGLAGRIGAIGLSIVNLVAVISYWHIFGSDAGVVGLRQHQLWGFMLAMLAIYGCGALSVDRILMRRSGQPPG